jgi:hypothetical protein
LVATPWTASPANQHYRPILLKAYEGLKKEHTHTFEMVVVPGSENARAFESRRAELTCYSLPANDANHGVKQLFWRFKVTEVHPW